MTTQSFRAARLLGPAAPATSVALVGLVALLALGGCGPKEAPVVAAEAASEAPPERVFVYPEAPRGEVSDDYHGTVVADPYRWLEDPDAPETRVWIEAQNALTRAYLDSIPERAALHARLTELWNYERFSTPSKEGGLYFWSRNDGLQDQSVLYVASALDAEPRVLIDPNGFSEDGTVSLSGTSVSEDGRYIAYATSDGGSDWNTWRVRDIETGEDTDDLIEWSKFSGASWTHDGAGFFYSRYPQPEDPLEAVNEHQKLYYHRLGTPQSEDTLIYEDPAHPTRGWGGYVTRDGETLVIYGREGTEDKNRLYYKDLTEPEAPIVKLLDDFDAQYWLLHNEGRTWWLVTNNSAPKQRIIQVDLDRPEPEHWVEIVPEGDNVLRDADVVGGKLIVEYLDDAHTVVMVGELDGSGMTELELPGIGSAGGFGGEPDDPETFYYFTGFTTPTRLYRLDVSTGESTLWKEPEVDFDPDQYVTKQIFYPSKDGTQIPMFIVHKEGIELDGSNPTLLYGYGGFNVSLTPYFSTSRLVWMEQGGVFALANLRGGGEYGEEWHQQGTLHNKQNVFDDFIAAGEYLVAEGYTSPSKLAIQGGSNGGLLVGAVSIQRPDLFEAALPAVGVMDMLRYHLFTIGWAWASDYGRSDDPELFPTLMAYSPYHNLAEGIDYPATLVTTGDHDDRVVPAHSFKYAAALQHAHAGSDPVLIRIETRAGHGAGKSTSMKIDEVADQWAFLVDQLRD